MDLAIQGLGWAGTRSIVCLRLRPKTGVGETARELVHASSGLIMGIEGGDSHFVHHEVVNIEVKDDIYIGSVKIENPGYHFGLHREKPWVGGIAAFGGNPPGYDRFILNGSHGKGSHDRGNGAITISSNSIASPLPLASRFIVTNILKFLLFYIHLCASSWSYPRCQIDKVFLVSNHLDMHAS